MSKKNASAMKRIMSEMQELANDTSLEYAAAPTEVRRTHLWQDNLFEWHFTLRGPRGTEFERGMYHGKILLPTDYPFRPPDLVFLTPSGRWEVNNKVGLPGSSRSALLLPGSTKKVGSLRGVSAQRC